MKQIYLTQGKVAQVDDASYASVVAQGNWHATKAGRPDGIVKWYAARSLPWTEVEGRRIRPKLYLHRFIAGIACEDMLVDHFNGDGLDCTRDNLLVCQYYWNSHNRDTEINEKTGMRGVRLHHGGRYEARINFRREEFYLGHFDTAIEAALAYDAKAIELFGPLARTNLREGRLTKTSDRVRIFAEPGYALEDAIPF